MSAYFSTTISTAQDDDKYLQVKIRVLGKTDIRTAHQVLPWGVDSNPIKGLNAVYTTTTAKGDDAVLGYLVADLKAAVGEFRAYATDAQGVVKNDIHLKANGDIEIGGNANHLTQFEAFETHVQSIITKINTELGKISIAIAAVGGSYTVTAISETLTSAKTTKLKTA